MQIDPLCEKCETRLFHLKRYGFNCDVNNCFFVCKNEAARKKWNKLHDAPDGYNEEKRLEELLRKHNEELLKKGI